MHGENPKLVQHIDVQWHF